MSRRTRSSLLLLFGSYLVLFTFFAGAGAIEERGVQMNARGLLDPPTSGTESSTTSAAASATTSTSAASSASSAPTSATSTTSSSSSASSAPPTSTSHSDTTSAAQPTSTASPVTSNVVTTGSNGVSTVVVVTTPSDSASPSTTSSADSGSSGSSGLGTGSIVGLSVAGGVALIGIVAFFVWKFSRKRFSNFDDTEAIKWPELNSHGQDSHPLPTNSTGRAGFGNDSELSLSRSPSRTGYASSVGAHSTPELYAPGAAADPYAVPPLPHLNPNQPYHDDPNATAYYDPYRGPVPNTFSDGGSVDHHGGYGGEAIPMSQMAPGARMRSPAPQAAYDMTGRGSPQPSYPGRRSPGPQVAMGYGPGVPPVGRRSPGPQAAYDPGYGPQ